MADEYSEKQSTATASTAKQSSVTFSDLFGILRKHWITIVVTFVVVVGVMTLWTATRPVSYSSTAQLFAT